MFCHKWKEVVLFQAEAQYKAFKGQLQAQDRQEGGENRSKTGKLCVIGSPAKDARTYHWACFFCFFSKWKAVS